MLSKIHTKFGKQIYNNCLCLSAFSKNYSTFEFYSRSQLNSINKLVYCTHLETYELLRNQKRFFAAPADLSPNCISKYHKMEKDLKFRSDPVIATLDSPQFKLLFTPNLLCLIELFKKYNYEIRIAGGAVRLALFLTFTSLFFFSLNCPNFYI